MDMKLSFYSVFEKHPNGEQVIAFSTRSQELILLSNSVYKDLITQNFQNLPNETYKELVNGGFLVSIVEDELEIIIEENKKEIELSKSLYIVVQPSSNCQMGCNYCGQEHTKGSISKEDSDRILDRTFRRMKRMGNTINHLQVGWFGSEPLMGLREIRYLSERFIDLSEQFGITYGATMVTNGLSLKEKIFTELVTKYKVNSFEVTLDGLSDTHDNRRFLKARKGKNFDLIVNNLEKIFNIPNYDDLNAEISIRSNVDMNNPTSVEPLINFLSEKGFLQKISQFYVAPIHSWGNDAHLQSIEKEDFAKKEIDWYLHLISKGQLPNLLYPRKREVCMIVDPNAELYDADGNIFNCTEVSYVPSYKGSDYELGNLKEDQLNYKNKPLLDWNDQILEKKYPCGSCPILPICGGMCPKSWREDINACPSIKHNIKDRMVLASLVLEDQKRKKEERVFAL